MKLSIFVLFIFSTLALFSQQETEERLVPYRVGEKWGLSDFWGHIKVQPDYDAVYVVDRNLFVVKNKNKFGLIFNNKLVIPLIYDELIYNKSRLIEGYLFETGSRQVKRVNLYNKFGKKLNKGHLFSVDVLSYHLLSGSYTKGIPYMILGYYTNNQKKYEFVRVHDQQETSTRLELVIAGCDRITQSCSLFSGRKNELSVVKNKEMICYKINYEYQTKTTQLKQISSKEVSSSFDSRSTSGMERENGSIGSEQLSSSRHKMGMERDMHSGEPQNKVKNKPAQNGSRTTVSNKHYTIIDTVSNDGKPVYGLTTQRFTLDNKYDTIIAFRPRSEKSFHFIVNTTGPDGVKMSGIIKSDSTFLLPMTDEYEIIGYLHLKNSGLIMYRKDGKIGLRGDDGVVVLLPGYQHIKYVEYDRFLAYSADLGYCFYDYRYDQSKVWLKGCFKDVPASKIYVNGEDVYKMTDEQGQFLGYAQAKGPDKVVYYFYE